MPIDWDRKWHIVRKSSQTKRHPMSVILATADNSEAVFTYLTEARISTSEVEMLRFFYPTKKPAPRGGELNPQRLKQSCSTWTASDP